MLLNLALEIPADESARTSGGRLNGELTTSGANFLFDGPRFCGIIAALYPCSNIALANGLILHTGGY